MPTFEDSLSLFIILAGIITFAGMGTIFMITREWWRNL